MSYFREQLEEWLKTIDVKAFKVADVGGRELSVKDRVKSWDVKKYLIYDLPEYDLNKYPIYNDCNIVFCLEVFEYVYNPLVAFNNLSALLTKGGTLYASFPFVYPIHSPHRQDYLRYTRFGIMKLCEEAGLRIINLKTRVAKNESKLIDFYKSDGMHIKADSTVTGYLLTARK